MRSNQLSKYVLELSCCIIIGHLVNPNHIKEWLQKSYKDNKRNTNYREQQKLVYPKLEKQIKQNRESTQ